MLSRTGLRDKNYRLECLTEVGSNTFAIPVDTLRFPYQQAGSESEPSICTLFEFR